MLTACNKDLVEETEISDTNGKSTDQTTVPTFITPKNLKWEE